MTPTHPLRADAQRNRRRILDAAADLMAERGVDVPMEDIAHRADVGVGTLYRRFPDRDRLTREVAAEMFRLVNQFARTALATEPDGWSALARLIRHCADGRFGTLWAALRPWLSEHRDGDPELAGLAGEWTDLVARIVARAQREGTLRVDIDNVDVIMMIGLLSCRLPDVPRPRNQAMSRRYLEFLLDGLRARSVA
ncbi:TetR/AcrR family transcriptional regulator [Glycomyces tarimensis]